MASQRDIAKQMLAQLRILDPSVSGEIGTPERKIIDTVAQALADAQVDFSAVSGGLDLDAKFGGNLDRFLALFGFARQQSTRATGYVTFSRNTASTQDIRIPTNTQVIAPATSTVDVTVSPWSWDMGVIRRADGFSNVDVFYVTTFEAILPAGELSVTVPVQAITTGSIGNVEAGRVTSLTSTPVYGITVVTNEQPIIGGLDAESDDEYKVRFKNTVFRNLAGTEDQFLALAVATAFTTKVNVIGSVSKYREYLQVPSGDDTASIEVNPEPSDPEAGNGSAGEYTTAMSTVPNSKHTYEQAFVSNGQVGAETLFYREGIDWRMNTAFAAKNRGDTYRYWNSDVPDADKPGINPASLDATYQPNVSFINVYTGGDPEIELVRPGDVVLFEHSYLSTASRNDIDHNVTNCVDVYIDGGNIQTASTVIPGPGSSYAAMQFSSTPTSKYYNLNYRRNGRNDVAAAPSTSHIFIPLFWQPTTSLPDYITIQGELIADNSVQTEVFALNTNYWFVEDVSELRGTVRARNGIEFNPASDGDNGYSLAEFKTATQVPIEGYNFDQNVIDVQASYEKSKQITTDVLVHRAMTRYFKLDVTIMYGSGQNNALVNDNIEEAVNQFFARQYYGSTIQLSDILQVIHNVDGVDNVRWSSDIPGSSDTGRVTECDIDGVALTTHLVNGSYVSWDGIIDHDFFLGDNELPALPRGTVTGDTLPGLRVRVRAQNTWLNA